MVTCLEWKLAGGYMQQAEYAALTANHTISTFLKYAPDEATALTDNVSRHRLHRFPFFVKIPIARVIPVPAKLLRRDTDLPNNSPASQS